MQGSRISCCQKYAMQVVHYNCKEKTTFPDLLLQEDKIIF